MLGPLAFLCALLFPGGWAAISLEQPSMVVASTGSWATLPCKVSASGSYIHWYLHREGTAPKWILMLDMSSSSVSWDKGLRADKLNAKYDKGSKTCNLSIQKLEKSDEGVYYCAAWERDAQLDWYYWDHKVFGPGTLLRVSDKNPDEDTSPKPTIFLPSPDERKLHKAGTYLCLLEGFFPDIITIDWKEKNGKSIPKSQQRSTMKTKDTYMKYTWLTVTEESMDKEHTCIVQQEKYKGGVDQEILFPSTSKANLVTESKADIQGESETSRSTMAVTVSSLSTLTSSPFSSATAGPTSMNTPESRGYSSGTHDTNYPMGATTPASELTAVNSKEASLKDENDPLPLQLMNTSAYYTYVVLLIKSVVYSLIIAFCLLGGPALWDNENSCLHMVAARIPFFSLAIDTERVC